MALAKNTIYNLVPPVVAVVVTIVTVPFFIKLIGPERYGALLIAFVLLGYFGQADFGLGRALTQRLSSSPDATAEERASVVWSAIGGASLMSLIGGALIYLAAEIFFRSYFEASPELRAEVLSATWLFALCVPVIMLTGVTSGALGGLERFGMVAIGTTAGNVLSQSLPLVAAALWSNHFTWVLGASIVGRLLGLAPIAVSMVRVFLVRQPFNPSMTQLRRLFSFGSWVMLTAVIGPFMTMADRVVVGAVLGASAVVAYTVPVQLTMRTVLFPLAIISALFPRLAAQDELESARLGRSAVVLVGQLFGFIVIGTICLAEPLLNLWLGAKLDPRSILVGQISIIGIWTNALANVPYALIHARGNPRFTALLHTIELPIYGAMLFGFGSLFGLYGIVLALALRMGLDCAFLFYKAGFMTSDVLRRLVGPALLIALALLAAPWMQGWAAGIAGATVLCLALLAVTWWQLPVEARVWAEARLRR
jgi:O-antigen/teichoic acid export membrane protein